MGESLVFVGGDILNYIPTVLNFLTNNNIEFEATSNSSYSDFECHGIRFKCIDDTNVFHHVEIIDTFKSNNIILITNCEASKYFGKPNSKQSNGLKYQHKCPNPLIGVDIKLFDNDIEFPYKSDRPKCFYDVRVDGKKSAYDAFYDAHIRWKMIINRIQYSGGFIDSRQVLNALNITRTCKQPSWFSQSLAERIISEYCTSNTIYDLAAGWGARYDAAKKLGKKYVGCDYNKALVDWHHELGRNEIQYADGRYFAYSDDCSIFICPPYSDPKTGRCFEDYNFKGFDDSAKGLSQCDWLRIAINNASNASEAIMVCKIVDSGWDKYVVDIISNKSHFGKNQEYILKVDNDDFETVLNL